MKGKEACSLKLFFLSWIAEYMREIRYEENEILFLGDKTAAQLSGSEGMKMNNALQVVVILLSSAIFLVSEKNF